MADVGSPESLQIISPDVYPGALREVLTKVTNLAKEKVQEGNEQAAVSMEVTRMEQDFGLFGQAGISYQTTAQADQTQTPYVNVEAYLEAKEPKYYAPQEVEATAQFLVDKHHLEAEFEHGDDMDLKIKDRNLMISFVFGYPDRESAIKGYHGRTDEHLVGPSKRSNVFIYPDADGMSLPVEDQNGVLIEENVDKLVASVPIAIDLMTKVMEAANATSGQQVPQKTPKIVELD